MTTKPTAKQDSREEVAMSAECLAKKENNHEQMYLNWRHQGDGFNYYYCSMCGWIKPDLESPVITKYRNDGIKQAVARILNTQNEFVDYVTSYADLIDEAKKILKELEETNVK